MKQQDSKIQEIKEELDGNTSRINYLYRYTQMLALTSHYQAFAARNIALERVVRDRIEAEQRPIRVYYYVYLLDQVSYPLVDALQRDSRFELRVIAHTVEQVDFLRSRGLVCQLIHSAWSEHPEYSELNSEPFCADICFSEMPYGVLPSLSDAIKPWMISGGWLPKYEDIFPHYELQNSLFCMVHYAYFLADEWLWLKSNPELNVHYGLPYPNFCWIYFLESEDHLRFALDRNNFGNTRNYVVSGYPKYDTYLRAPEPTKSFSWKYASSERKRLVYAPHFKRSERVLSDTLEKLLLLGDTEKYEIIFKPHPVYNRVVNEMTPKFAAHPSCQVVRGNDCSQYIFATADLSIISSVSMHADGLFSGKPYITELDESNFNHIGKEVHSAGYLLTAETDLAQLIDRILVQGDDPKKPERDRLRAKLTPVGSSAVDKILSTILDKLKPS